MALDDRDYMQGPQAPSDAPPAPLFDLRAMWLKLLVVNLLVYLAYQPDPGVREFIETQFVFSGARVTSGAVWTLITSAFCQLTFPHIFSNMVLFVVFARDLEVLYGGKNLLALYLFAAVGAAVPNLLLLDPRIQMLGASGAIMGIVVAAALNFPRRRILVFPLWTLAALLVLLDLSGATWRLGGVRDHIAHGAHLGGAAAGALFKVFDLRPFSATTAGGARLGPGLFARARRTSPPGGVPLDDRIAPPAALRPGDALALEVDDILRKISRDGIESLSDAERTVLERASQTYRSDSGRRPRP